MRTKFLTAILAGGFVVVAGAAMADPLRLSEKQMDGVNAGALALAAGAAAALGNVVSATNTNSAAVVIGPNAAAANVSTAAALSAFAPAVAQTASSSAAFN